MLANAWFYCLIRLLVAALLLSWIYVNLSLIESFIIELQNLFFGILTSYFT